MEFKAALVTGAGKRLGRAMALTLAKRGIAVAVHYASSKTEAESVVAEITSMGGQAVALHADLLDESQANKLIAQSADGLGQPLDVLINNASIFDYDTIVSATRESWDRHMMSNLRAPFLLTQGLAAQVKGGAQGCIVNMIDQRVRKLTPEFMTYTLAKSALWTLTQTSAQALAPLVRVNAIGPGTTLRGARQSQEHFDKQRMNSLLQRGADVEDITTALSYLLDAPAVTGQLICVDGGQHLGWQTPDIIGVE